jgi:ABC-type amino acid transport substrate-binding protein
MIHTHVRVVLSILLFAIPQLSFAAEENGKVQHDEEFNSWQHTLTPLYLWGVSMSGTMAIADAVLPLELEFSDAVSDLETAFTVHYEGAKGNWGIILDYSYLNLTPSVDTGTPLSVDVDLKNNIVEVAGLYRFGADSPWQLLAGYRSYTLDATIKGLPSPPLTTDRITIDETINDFFVGGRYVTRINDKWSFTGRADIGAGDSDLVWNAFAAFHYQFTKLLSGFVGWRVMDYEVDQGSGNDRFRYDMNHSGPVLAIAFDW